MDLRICLICISIYLCIYILHIYINIYIYTHIQTNIPYHYISLHYHYITYDYVLPLHCITYHYIALPCITLHYLHTYIHTYIHTCYLKLWRSMILWFLCLRVQNSTSILLFWVVGFRRARLRSSRPAWFVHIAFYSVVAYIDWQWLIMVIDNG